MQTTHTRIYRDTLKELKMLALLEDEKTKNMLKKVIEFYKQTRDSVDNGGYGFKIIVDEQQEE